MDDSPTKENPPKDFNQLDLSQLQRFSFGPQCTQDKSSAPAGGRERTERPRRDGPGGGAPERRDRRSFRQPAWVAGAAPAGGEGAPEHRERREFSGERGPRHDGPGRGERGGPRYERRSEPQERGPYESPFFTVAFYPEDTSFNALAKTIRSSCRTIELFEIARTVVDKLDRFVVVLTRKPSDSPASKAPLYLSAPDGLPFDTEDAAVSHVLTHHLERFFDLAEVEVDPPKGNFQVINKCTVTGELLGPPNYHRYAQIVQQHHAAKVARMPFETYRSRIETVRDPDVVAQWLEKMKKTTRYTWKLSDKSAAAPRSESAPAETAVPAETNATPAEATPGNATETETAPAEAASAPAIPAVPAFDSFEEARSYLLTEARDKVVRAIASARFHGKIAEQLPPGEIRRAIEGALERQRRFPLDTANALRGRLRREHFTIFKKGSKGVSYVCAVKRKFRVPGQTFAESISALISFIEASPMVRASELPHRFLGFDQPATPKAEPTTVPAASGAVAPVAESSPGAEAPAAESAAAAVAPESVLTIDQRARMSRMQGDLRWLVTEGYVTEFIDGRLFAPPPVAESRKKTGDAEEHDPENFPEAPADAIAAQPASAPMPASAPVEENRSIPETPVAEEPVAPAPAATDPIAAKPVTPEEPPVTVESGPPEAPVTEKPDV
jgi:hypothetical protein